MSEKMYLGIDSSTQSLKAVLMNDSREIVKEVNVNFDADLPEFDTKGGVHKQRDGLTVTSPALMWVKALDLLMKRMRSEDVPFEKIAAISGSGQQHGTVYLLPGTEKVLSELNPREPLANQLINCFSIQDSPVWMDASTTRECQALEAALGGPQALAEISGSRAYERFSGNQIARIARLNKERYEATERIALVSSFMASLLACKYVPIDFSDGSGMNLLDIRSKEWNQKALQTSARGLAAKLGEPQASHKVAGSIGQYFVEKYGFDKECRVVTFSGDNPCSLAGLRLDSVGDVAISMGTSDTMFGTLSSPQPSATEGHIFVNPIDPESYMAMIVYTNGSLMREEIRDRSAKGTWDCFEESLANTVPGNDGNIGFFYRDAEITPPILKPGIFCFDSEGNQVRKFTPEQEVRAVVEGQFLSMRLHSGNVGIQPTRILATGGGSANKGILKVISEVFGVPVYVGDAPASAAFGAAYRALHGYECEKRGEFVPFSEVMAGAPSFRKVLDGVKTPVYDEMLKRYAELEKDVISKTA